MSDLFRPIGARQLARWVFEELDAQDSIFGIPRKFFFEPAANAPYRRKVFGQALDTPIGPAAGPHSQMAQNIVAAWLCGARYVELKTVQTIDELTVSKPCIDMEDVGYNVEWSQELKVEQSFDEYLLAWILVHALHHRLGFEGKGSNTVFNISVGYDLAGIRQPNMQWFLDQVSDASSRKQELVEAVGQYYPAVRDIDVPDRLSDNVTLSTMHGCPPDEIEGICEYLLRNRRLHTLVKCNPTLLGPDEVRGLLNKELGFADVVVPDIAFEHDLRYDDAVPMLRRLQGVARDCGLDFGVKLSNTLEVENRRQVFSTGEAMMYLSGRPLHAITVNLAARLAHEFDGDLPMSFSAGASCYNVANLLQAGMQTITVCSDLLKTGGYMRLLDYVEAIKDVPGEPEEPLEALRRYAEQVRSDPDNMKSEFATSGSKTDRELGPFDCIEAPCIDACPLEQKVPHYMNAVRQGSIDDAQGIIRADNPLPCTLGRICDHLCEQACVRTHLDEPVAIRDIKRYVVDRDYGPEESRTGSPGDPKVAIIGAGPGGMSAAMELARAGATVEVFEQQDHPGGMVGGVVPEYRLPNRVFARDFATLDALGVQVHYNVSIGKDLALSKLCAMGFDNVVIMVGAQLGKSLPLEDSDADGVVDALEFLRESKKGSALTVGRRVGIIGAGDTAMDCARVAWRLGDRDVKLIYRRSIDQMPADREEITQLLEEGIEVLELSAPSRLLTKDSALTGLRCMRMSLSDELDKSGRRIPVEVPDSEFDIELDTLILAISQQPMLEFLAGVPIELTSDGYIKTNPGTFETSVPGVYAGGDAANEGPATIVKAAAAGKAIARSILRSSVSRNKVPVTPFPGNGVTGTLFQGVAASSVTDPELLRRRSHRLRRVPAPRTAPEDRQNFKEVMLTYDDEQAHTEAARCLDCHAYCSICVGVCPNLALFTYRTDEREQPYQVAVIADLCNECGNCTTFCPTAGAPYRDKPRLYLDKNDFDAEHDNAYRIVRNKDAWTMDARRAGRTQHIELNGERNEELDDMLTLLRGVKQSMPFLPVTWN